MSALMEYLRLIPTALNNFDKVAEGIVNTVKANFGNLDENEQKEIARRLLICKECPFLSSNAVSNPAIKYKTDRIDEHCIQCGCNIHLKTSSLLSNCGIEQYNKKNPDAPMELRWTAYLKTNENGNNSKER